MHLEPFLRFAFVAILTLPLIAPAAQAQTDAPEAVQADVKEHCKSDYLRFCPTVLPGGGRIAVCLAGHKDELSQPCRDSLAHARAIMQK